jgi:hypothetical protein
MAAFLFESAECLALVIVGDNVDITGDLDDMPTARNIASD